MIIIFEVTLSDIFYKVNKGKFTTGNYNEYLIFFYKLTQTKNLKLSKVFQKMAKLKKKNMKY
jgi:hypothetical protein